MIVFKWLFLQQPTLSPKAEAGYTKTLAFDSRKLSFYRIQLLCKQYVIIAYFQSNRRSVVVKTCLGLNNKHNLQAE